MRIAEVKVAKTTCETTCIAAIPKGIVGATVSIEYTDSVWEDLQKTVVFRSAVTKDVIAAGNEVVIPSEVVSHAGMNLYMGVYGVNAENNVVIPTIWTDLGMIRSAAAPSGDASSDPSLPVWAQIQAMIGNLDDLNTDAKSSLVAAINEAPTKDDLGELKDDLAAEQTAREQSDTSLQQEISGKLPKSPADWEAWTTEEQAAARERIGADGGEMELIAEVTTTEELDVISVSNFPDGTQLKLKSFMIYFVIPKASSDSLINSGYKMNYGNNLSINRDSSNNLIKSGFDTHNNMYVLWNNARPIGLVTKCASWANGSAEIESVFKYDNQSDSNANYISEVHLSKYTNGIKIPSGTMLKLYGVRV